MTYSWVVDFWSFIIIVCATEKTLTSLKLMHLRKKYWWSSHIYRNGNGNRLTAKSSDIILHKWSLFAFACRIVPVGHAGWITRTIWITWAVPPYCHLCVKKAIKSHYCTVQHFISSEVSCYYSHDSYRIWHKVLYIATYIYGNLLNLWLKELKLLESVTFPTVASRVPSISPIHELCLFSACLCSFC